MDCHSILGPRLSGLYGTQANLRPSSPSNMMDWYVYPPPSFERNFSLADLHELVDHFEGAHVVAIGPDGNPVYPSSQMGSNPDSPSPYHSVMPFANAVFADHRAGIPIETLGATHIHCASTAHALVSDLDAPPVDLTAGQLCLPPSSFTAEMHCRTEAQASHDHPGPPRMGKRRPRGHGVSRRRDKSHKCPSYLNANGLKYHLEKGTCSLDTGVEAAPQIPRPNCPKWQGGFGSPQWMDCGCVTPCNSVAGAINELVT
ncbi:hypothetical protein HD554DRAFT_2038992 [Boletus coccyginus]|nr:hypothetical protein HD554DRAFT_2038992 [Boletus coccyginus]